MKRSNPRGRAAIAALLVASGFATHLQAAILYNPVVVNVGDGVGTTGGTGYTTTLREYDPSLLNGQVSSIAYTGSTPGTRLVTSVSATSEGTLTNNGALADNAAKGLSSTSGCVFNAGYDAANGTASVNGTAANAPRAFGYASVAALAGLSSATVGVTQPQAQTYDNNNIRGATGNNAASAFWGAGTGTAANAGWRYVDSSNNVQVSSTVTNTRTVEILSNQLFGSTGSGTRGIYAIGTGTPSTGGQTATLLVGTGASASPYEFVLIDDPNNNASTATTFGYDTAYIADDSAAGSNGGIQKWVWNGTAWTNAYTMSGGLSVGMRGLAGQLDADTNQVVLWGTTGTSSSAANALYQITDTGSAASVFTKIADAPANTVFRGVALAPAPEPGSIALLAGAATLTGLRRRRRH